MPSLKLLALASEESPAHERNALLQSHARVTTLMPTTGLHPHVTLHGKDELHSALSKLDCHKATVSHGGSESQCKLIDASTVPEREAWEFLDYAKAAFAIDSPGWHTPTGLQACRKSLAACKAASPLLEHAKHDAILCCEPQLLDAAVMTATEHGLPLVVELNSLYAGHSPLREGMQSRINTGIENASAIIANDTSLLRQLPHSPHARRNQLLCEDAVACSEIAGKLYEARQLAEIAFSPKTLPEERRAAANYHARLLQQTGKSNWHNAAFGRVAAVSEPLNFNFQFDRNAAKRRAKNLRTMTGSRLGELGGRTFGCIATTPAAFLSFARAFSLTPHDDAAIVFAPAGITQACLKLAEGTGLQRKTALAAQGDAGLMAACNAIASPEPAEKLAMCAATNASLHGPALFFGSTAPMVYAASETPFGEAAAVGARLLEDASAKSELAERLKRISAGVAREQWSAQDHAHAFARFLQAALG